MTKLELAFTEAAKLSQSEQDALAEWILEELTSERRWEEVFAHSSDELEHLAEEAIREHRASRTQRLDPDHL